MSLIELLAAGSEIDARNRYQATALHCAAAQGHVAAAVVLLCAGAEADINDINGVSPASLAAKRGDKRLRLCLEHAAQGSSRRTDVVRPQGDFALECTCRVCTELQQVRRNRFVHASRFACHMPARACLARIGQPSSDVDIGRCQDTHDLVKVPPADDGLPATTPRCRGLPEPAPGAAVVPFPPLSPPRDEFAAPSRRPRLSESPLSSRAEASTASREDTVGWGREVRGLADASEEAEVDDQKGGSGSQVEDLGWRARAEASIHRSRSVACLHTMIASLQDLQ